LVLNGGLVRVSAKGCSGAARAALAAPQQTGFDPKRTLQAANRVSALSWIADDVELEGRRDSKRGLLPKRPSRSIGLASG